MNVRLQQAQQSLHGRIIEQNDVVDTTQGCDELGTIRSGEDRTPRPFESGHRSIVVHRDNETVRHFCRALQVPDMADVQQIEAAVGEGNRAAVLAIARDGRHKLALVYYSSQTLAPDS